MSRQGDDELLAAVKRDETRRAVEAARQRDAEMAKVIRHIEKLRLELHDLKQRPVTPPVQKILITEAFATGIAFGVGFLLAPLFIAIVAGIVLFFLGLSV